MTDNEETSTNHLLFIGITRSRYLSLPAADCQLRYLDFAPEIQSTSPTSTAYEIATPGISAEE